MESGVRPSSNPSLRVALAEMTRHPFSSLVLKWNWKSAVTSIMLRAPVFFAATVRGGIRLALAGALVEAAFNGVGAGFYGAFLQGIRGARPIWAVSLVGALAVPAAIQLSGNLVHFLLGTIVLRRGIAISIALSAITALFNLYAMRRGNLITGKEALPLHRDLMRLPHLIGGFLLIVPRLMMRRAGTGKKPPIPDGRGGTGQ
jgi:hypothetical protein